MSFFGKIKKAKQLQKEAELKSLAEKAYKENEKTEYTVTGNMVHSSQHGDEIVDGMLVMTNHRVLVVKKPLFDKKVDSFTYAQVSCVTKEKDSVTLCAPGQNYTVSEVTKGEDADKFTTEFGLKKKPKRATVDVGVTMRRDDIKA